MDGWGVMYNFFEFKESLYDFVLSSPSPEELKFCWATY